MKRNLNLWELLKASKGIPVADPMVVLWGQQYRKKHGIAEISGVPPLEFTSRGGNLIDYRIYGYTDDEKGCGERTENLFDVGNVTNGASLSPDDGSLVSSPAYNTSNFIDVSSNSYYTLSLVSVYTGYRLVRIAYYDSEKTFLSVYNSTSFRNEKKAFTIRTPANTKYVRFSYIGVSSELEDRDIMFVLGSTAPTSYIPYGYVVGVALFGSGSGDNAFTPIYVGSEPLYDGEYVSFSEQKIYRVVEGALTPVSAELPAIPTFTGWNGLRVYTEIEPSEMYIKYKKG